MFEPILIMYMTFHLQKKVGWLDKRASILQLRLVLTRIEGTKASDMAGWNDIDSPM